MTSKGDIEVKQEPGDAGIKITPTEGELEPPLSREGVIEQEEPGEEIAPKRVTGKVPIHPAVIKPPLRFEGQVLAEVTGYPGWIYSEEDLEDFAQLIAECGLEMDPRIQVLIGLTTLHATKFIGFQTWKRTGRPGDLKQKEGEGEIKRTKRPKDEEVI